MTFAGKHPFRVFSLSHTDSVCFVTNPGRHRVANSTPGTRFAPTHSAAHLSESARIERLCMPFNRSPYHPRCYGKRGPEVTQSALVSGIPHPFTPASCQPMICRGSTWTPRKFTASRRVFPSSVASGLVMGPQLSASPHAQRKSRLRQASTVVSALGSFRQSSRLVQ